MLSENSIDLLFVLNKKESCTLEYLSMKLNLSKNSVINLLDELEDYLETIADSHVHLARKSGEGIKLIDEYQEMNKVLVKLSRHYIMTNQGIYNGRCVQAILILINETDHLTLQDLADRLYVSKGTIVNDIELIEKILYTYHIKLVRIRNRGIKISGLESNVRKLFSDIVRGKVNKAPIQVLAYDNMNSLYSLFNKEYVDKVHDLIVKMINEDIELSNIQISAVLVHVMIAIQRIQNGESLKMSNENFEKIEKTKYYKVSKNFTQEIEKLIDLTFDKEEIGYIAIHLMCAKKVLQIYDLAKEEYEVIDEHLKEVVNMCLQVISQETGNDSAKDRELVDGLILHLKPSIERIRN
ncbi:MAG: PRD domain-containing protein, partial [Coprobacillus sp.]